MLQILSAQSTPNIVIILADDLGYRSVNYYGAPKKLIPTPHVDRLASDGMRFTDANSPGSLCSPTRYALLTGRYAWRGRLKHGTLSPPEGALLIENEQIWGLRSKGKHPYGKSSYKGRQYHGYEAYELAMETLGPLID